jgi:hypothetical protein
VQPHLTPNQALPGYLGATPQRVDLGKVFSVSSPTFWPIAVPISVELR